jgi:hypothetical protein
LKEFFLGADGGCKILQSPLAFLPQALKLHIEAGRGITPRAGQLFRRDTASSYPAAHSTRGLFALGE